MVVSLQKYALVFITIIVMLLDVSLGQLQQPCLAAQECIPLATKSSPPESPPATTQTTIKCSQHGKCFYDLYRFILNYETQKEFLQCVCDEGYTNTGNLTVEDVRCCYKQKEQFTAFLLEVIPGFGAGHFYLGNMTLFWIKCMIVTGLILTMIILKIILWCNRSKDPNPNEGSHMNNKSHKDNTSPKSINCEIIIGHIILLLFLIIVLWQAIDTILFGMNFYQDSEKISLKPW